MAQLGARLNRTQEVRGSIPLSSTDNKGVTGFTATPFYFALPISYQMDCLKQNRLS